MGVNSGFQQLPAGLNHLLTVVVGQPWPEGDVDGLWAMAHAWNAYAKQLDARAPDVLRAASLLRQSMTGAIADQAAHTLQTHLHDAIKQLSQQSQALGTQAQNGAADIQKARIEISIMLVILAATIIQLAISIFGSPAIPGLIATARVSIGLLLKELMTKLGEVGAANILKSVAFNAAKYAALNAGLMTGLDFLIQGFQQAGGIRKGWDTSSLEHSAIAGAIGGAAFGLVHGLGGQIGKAIDNIDLNALSKLNPKNSGSNFKPVVWSGLEKLAGHGLYIGAQAGAFMLSGPLISAATGGPMAFSYAGILGLLGGGIDKGTTAATGHDVQWHANNVGGKLVGLAKGLGGGGPRDHAGGHNGSGQAGVSGPGRNGSGTAGAGFNISRKPVGSGSSRGGTAGAQFNIPRRPVGSGSSRGGESGQQGGIATASAGAGQHSAGQPGGVRTSSGSGSRGGAGVNAGEVGNNQASHHLTQQSVTAGGSSVGTAFTRHEPSQSGDVHTSSGSPVGAGVNTAEVSHNGASHTASAHSPASGQPKLTLSIPEPRTNSHGSGGEVSSEASSPVSPVSPGQHASGHEDFWSKPSPVSPIHEGDPFSAPTQRPVSSGGPDLGTSLTTDHSSAGVSGLSGGDTRTLGGGGDVPPNGHLFNSGPDGGHPGGQPAPTVLGGSQHGGPPSELHSFLNNGPARPNESLVPSGDQTIQPSHSGTENSGSVPTGQQLPPHQPAPTHGQSPSNPLFSPPSHPLSSSPPPPIVEHPSMPVGDVSGHSGGAGQPFANEPWTSVPSSAPHGAPPTAVDPTAAPPGPVQPVATHPSAPPASTVESPTPNTPVPSSDPPPVAPPSTLDGASSPVATPLGGSGGDNVVPPTVSSNGSRPVDSAATNDTSQPPSVPATSSNGDATPHSSAPSSQPPVKAAGPQAGANRPVDPSASQADIRATGTSNSARQAPVSVPDDSANGPVGRTTAPTGRPASTDQSRNPTPVPPPSVVLGGLRGADHRLAGSGDGAPRHDDPRPGPDGPPNEQRNPRPSRHDPFPRRVRRLVSQDSLRSLRYGLEARLGRRGFFGGVDDHGRVYRVRLEDIPAHELRDANGKRIGALFIKEPPLVEKLDGWARSTDRHGHYYRVAKGFAQLGRKKESGETVEHPPETLADAINEGVVQPPRRAPWGEEAAFFGAHGEQRGFRIPLRGGTVMTMPPDEYIRLLQSHPTTRPLLDGHPGRHVVMLTCKGNSFRSPYSDPVNGVRPTIVEDAAHHLGAGGEFHGPVFGATRDIEPFALDDPGTATGIRGILSVIDGGSFKRVQLPPTSELRSEHPTTGYGHEPNSRTIDEANQRLAPGEGPDRARPDDRYAGLGGMPPRRHQDPYQSQYSDSRRHQDPYQSQYSDSRRHQDPYQSQYPDQHQHQHQHQDPYQHQHPDQSQYPHPYHAGNSEPEPVLWGLDTETRKDISFSPSDVVSEPIFDYNGRLIGVSFPAAPDDRALTEAWASAPRFTSDSQIYRSVPGIGDDVTYEGPFNAPWRNPIYVNAHGNMRSQSLVGEDAAGIIRVRSRSNPNETHKVAIGPRTVATILKYDRYYHEAAGGNPNRPVVYLGCFSAHPEKDELSPLADQLHQMGENRSVWGPAGESFLVRGGGRHFPHDVSALGFQNPTDSRGNPIDGSFHGVHPPRTRMGGAPRYLPSGSVDNVLLDHSVHSSGPSWNERWFKQEHQPGDPIQGHSFRDRRAEEEFIQANFPYLPAINRARFEGDVPGHRTNCGNAFVQLDRALANPARAAADTGSYRAAPSGLVEARAVEAELGFKFRELKGGYDAVLQQMRDVPVGARGRLFVEYESGPGHFFHVANVQDPADKVPPVFLDGHTGRVSSVMTGSKPVRWNFAAALPTTPADQARGRGQHGDPGLSPRDESPGRVPEPSPETLLVRPTEDVSQKLHEVLPDASDDVHKVVRILAVSGGFRTLTDPARTMESFGLPEDRFVGAYDTLAGHGLVQSGPSGIAFSPRGHQLLVPSKESNQGRLDTVEPQDPRVPLPHDGTPSNHTTTVEPAPRPGSLPGSLSGDRPVEVAPRGSVPEGPGHGEHRGPDSRSVPSEGSGGKGADTRYAGLGGRPRHSGNSHGSVRGVERTTGSHNRPQWTGDGASRRQPSHRSGGGAGYYDHSGSHRYVSSSGDTSGHLSGGHYEEPLLKGYDASETEVYFRPSDVRSRPIVDYYGRVIGVLFPTKDHPEGSVHNDEQVSAAWAQRPNRTSDNWIRKGHEEPAARDGMVYAVGPYERAPWSGMPRPIYVDGHADRQSVGVEVTVNGRSVELGINGDTGGQILRYNRWYHEAAAGDPERPVVFLGCQPAHPDSFIGRDMAADLHGHGENRWFFSSIGKAGTGPSTGEHGPDSYVTYEDGESTNGGPPIPGGFVGIAPPSHVPPRLDGARHGGDRHGGDRPDRRRVHEEWALTRAGGRRHREQAVHGSDERPYRVIERVHSSAHRRLGDGNSRPDATYPSRERTVGSSGYSSRHDRSSGGTLASAGRPRRWVAADSPSNRLGAEVPKLELELTRAEVRMARLQLARPRSARERVDWRLELELEQARVRLAQMRLDRRLELEDAQARVEQARIRLDRLQQLKQERALEQGGSGPLTSSANTIGGQWIDGQWRDVHVRFRAGDAFSRPVYDRVDAHGEGRVTGTSFLAPQERPYPDLPTDWESTTGTLVANPRLDEMQLTMPGESVIDAITKSREDSIVETPWAGEKIIPVDMHGRPDSFGKFTLPAGTKLESGRVLPVDIEVKVSNASVAAIVLASKSFQEAYARKPDADLVGMICHVGSGRAAEEFMAEMRRRGFRNDAHFARDTFVVTPGITFAGGKPGLIGVNNNAGFVTFDRDSWEPRTRRSTTYFPSEIAEIRAREDGRSVGRSTSDYGFMDDAPRRPR